MVSPIEAKHAASQRINEAMKLLRVTTEDVSDQTGISRSTFLNVKCGASKSRRARQVITNALRTDEIWPGFKVTERRLWLKPQTAFECPSVKIALEIESELRGFAERQGRIVIVTQPVLLRLDQAATAKSSADRVAKSDSTVAFPAARKSQEVSSVT